MSSLEKLENVEEIVERDLWLCHPNFVGCWLDRGVTDSKRSHELGDQCIRSWLKRQKWSNPNITNTAEIIRQIHTLIYQNATLAARVSESKCIVGVRQLLKRRWAMSTLVVDAHDSRYSSEAVRSACSEPQAASEQSTDISLDTGWCAPAARVD